MTPPEPSVTLMPDLDGDPDQFAVECEQVVAGFAELLWRVHRTHRLGLVADLIAGCPATQTAVIAEVDGGSLTFFARTVRSFAELGSGPAGNLALQLLTGLPPERQALLKLCVTAVTRGWNLGPA